MYLRPKLHTNQTITIKNNKPRVNKSKDEAPKDIAEEVRKSEDDVIKNNCRSPAARTVLNKYISQLQIHFTKRVMVLPIVLHPMLHIQKKSLRETSNIQSRRTYQ